MYPDAVGDIGASPQLACAIINYAGEKLTGNVIFITSDPEYNQASAQIALTSGSTVLEPGTIPDPLSPPGPGDGTTIYFDFSMLELPGSVWEGMTFHGAGWRFEKFPELGIVGMTPAEAPIPLSSGTAGAIPIEIRGLVVAEALSVPQVQIYVSYYNVPDVVGPYTTFAVSLVARPDERHKDLASAIGASLSANGIINSPAPPLTAANQFALQFTNLGQLVPAGEKTSFSVTFVYGAASDPYGFGALTDVTKANEISVRAGDNAEGWVITPDRNRQEITWTLVPPPGAPIVGTGAQSVVAIGFTNVVTAYQPGPTAMLVTYRNVPGYKDGTYTLVLNKIQHVQIRSLEVSPNPTYFSAAGTADVTVRWQAAGAQSLKLTQSHKTTPVTGKTELPATLHGGLTVFGLEATGRPGTVENSDYASVDAIALPVINSFAGTPTEIYYGTHAHDASFDWAVGSAADVRLYSTGGAFTGQKFRATGSTSASIFETQMVTLSPETEVNPLTLTRRLVLSAFRPTPKNYQLPFTPSSVIASPAGPFVLIAGPSTELTVLDTVRYENQGTYDLGHPVSALAFSADGGTLATANADKTVSLIRVRSGPAGMPEFEPLGTLTFAGNPRQLVFGADAKRVFVTLDPDGGAAGEVASLLESPQGYKIEEQPVRVGKKPRGITFDAAGGRLFVANSGDDTIALIGLTNDGGFDSGTKSTFFSGFPGGPQGIAATPRGQQLLVSCGDANDTSGTMWVLDPNHPEDAQRHPLPVGGSPGQIALLPGGAYAMVTNGTDGTISLVDCWGRPREAEIPGPAIPVGTRPTGVTASPDGLQVLVAVDGGFCVVTLATYQASAQRPAIPNRPTSVAVSADGGTVFAWHDARVSGPRPPGILVYYKSSRTIANLLDDKNIMRFAASPDPRVKEGFAIVQGDPALHVIATDTLRVSRYPLGLPDGTVPVELAVSGEGQTVFIVVSSPSRDLSLLVLEERERGWTRTQTLPLYRAGSNGTILLRSTPDATTLFLVDVAAAVVRVLRRTRNDYGLLPQKITGEARALDLAILPDGSTAYVLNSGQTANTITVIDVASLASRVVAVPQPYVTLTAIEPSPDGRRIFATDTSAAALRVLDPRSLRILQTIQLADRTGSVRGIAGLAVTPDGSSIFTANTDTENVSIVDQIRMGAIPQTGTAGTPAAAPVLAPAATRTRLIRDPSAVAYDGLFVRHYLNEKPGSPRDGWSASPDVFPFGETSQPDPQKFTTPEGYMRDWGKEVYTENDNYVYVRGLNTGPEAITSRVYFYYTRGALALWPANWQSDNVTVNGVPQNWVDVKAPANGGVGVNESPLIWTPDKLSPGSDHYCVISWVADGPNPQPPDLERFRKFATHDELIQFIVTHHNMGWRNTVQVLKPPPNYSYDSALSTTEAGAVIHLSIGFIDLPLDGTFGVNVVGPDRENSIALPPSPLEYYQGGYRPRNPLAFPAGFTTSVQVRYWKGSEPVPPTAQIVVELWSDVPNALVRDIERLYRPMGLRTPLVRVGNAARMRIGSAQYHLLFDSQAYRAAVK